MAGTFLNFQSQKTLNKAIKSSLSFQCSSNNNYNNAAQKDSETLKDKTQRQNAVKCSKEFPSGECNKDTPRLSPRQRSLHITIHLSEMKFTKETRDI